MIPVTYYGTTVHFPELPDRARLFSRLQQNEWGASIFSEIAQYVDKQTTFVDIGAWIGVTPYWSAYQAAHVIAVEPDPVCFDILTQMKAMNDVSIELVHAALSPEKELKLSAVGGFGSSRTSALIADDATHSITASTVTIAQLQDKAPTPKLFFKIDVEGYEYKLMHQFEQIDRARTCGIILAVHPQILAQSLSGNGFMRRWKAFKETLRLAKAFDGFKADGSGILKYAIKKILLNKRIGGFDVLLVPVR